MPVPVRDVEDVVAVPAASAAINMILVARGEAKIRVETGATHAGLR